LAQVSAEARWFLSSAFDEDVKAFDAWFRAGKHDVGGGKEPRTDVYLKDATEELGVKRRGKNVGVEVKALVEPKAFELQMGSLRSPVQLWSKVRSEVLTIPDDPAKKFTTVKMRWLRKFETSDSGWREVQLGGGISGEDPAKGASPEVGCNVEWTSVEVPHLNQVWWTFGLEAFAFNQPRPVQAALDSLQRALTGIDANLGSPPTLGPAWLALSYPAWIRGNV
jgi:hypothetical protein